MSTIADKLTAIDTIKSDLKTSIEAKGVTVGASAFNQYPSFVDSITGGGSSGDDGSWSQAYYDAILASRPPLPTDWVTMPSLVATDQIFYGLCKVHELGGNFVTMQAWNDYTIDWGDGSAPENYAAGTVAYHNLDWAGCDSGTLTTEEFRQALVTVTPQSGQALNTIVLNNKHTQTLPSYYSTPWLDINVAMNNTGQVVLYASDVYHRAIKRFNWVGTNAQSSFNRMFYNCDALIYVDLYSGAATNLSEMFSRCTALITIPMIDVSSATSTYKMFASCTSLKTIPALDFSAASSLGTINDMFSWSPTLERIPPLSFSVAGSFASLFEGCYSLSYIGDITSSASLTRVNNMCNYCFNLKHLPNISVTSNITNFSTVAGTCYALEEIPNWDFSSGSSFYQAFYSCYTLKEVPYIDLSSATDISQIFGYCKSLETVNEGLDFSNVTTMTRMFTGCISLSAVPTIDASSATIAYGAFDSCETLQSINIINAQNITNITSIFKACYSLSYIGPIDFSGVTTAPDAYAFKLCHSCRQNKMSGISQTFYLTDNALSADALEEVFTNLPTVETTKTILITGNFGAADLTQAQRDIAINKNWSISG